MTLQLIYNLFRDPTEGLSELATPPGNGPSQESTAASLGAARDARRGVEGLTVPDRFCLHLEKEAWASGPDLIYICANSRELRSPARLSPFSPRFTKLEDANY